MTDEAEPRTLEQLATIPSDSVKKDTPKTPKHPSEDWLEKYAAVVDFATVNGHLQVSPGTEWTGVIIGHWIRNHRVKDRDDKLTTVKREFINRIPHWDSRPGTVIHDWDGKFEIVKKAVETHGLEALFLSAEYFGLATGKWARTQRRRRKEGSLTKEQIDRLKSIRGWVWNVDAAKKRAGKKQRSAWRTKGMSRPVKKALGAVQVSTASAFQKGGGQPTRGAVISISPDIEPADIGSLQDVLVDHLQVGGRRLVPDARYDQFMIIAWHSTSTNIITIEWANPQEVIEDGERMTQRPPTG